MLISAIVAMAANRAIGYQGGIPWPKLKADMRLFRANTDGKAVLMGRKTWQSIPQKFRPLPNRYNIVATRESDGATAREMFPGADRLVDSVEAAVLATASARIKELVVIGGGMIYREALPLVRRLYITELEGIFPSDCSFPELDMSDWGLTYSEKHNISEDNPISFTFCVYDHRTLLALPASK